MLGLTLLPGSLVCDVTLRFFPFRLGHGVQHVENKGRNLLVGRTLFGNEQMSLALGLFLYLAQSRRFLLLISL